MGLKVRLLKMIKNVFQVKIREGLTAVVSVKHGDPQFEGQTKTKLGNSEVRQIVDRLFSEHFERFYMRIQILQESLLKKELWRQEHV